jgi:hypothetical protein
MRYSCVGIVLLALAFCQASLAQVPVEWFTGHERSSLDVLWFRPFRDKQQENTPFLFFSRSRALVDYHNRTSFGATSAVSYNFSSGLGLVAVAQFFGNGFFPKAGVQYFGKKRSLTVFTWLVAETLRDPAVDLFLLARFEPPLNSSLKLFSQVELVNNTDGRGHYQLIQRVRLGVGFQPGWQAGVGTDFQQVGNDAFTYWHNAGVFIRKEL